MEQISEKFSLKGYGIHIYNVVTNGKKWNYNIVITSPTDRQYVDEYKECRECIALNAQEVVEIAKQFAVSYISDQVD